MDVIFSHNACPDGWCAAFIAKLRYPKAEMIFLNHGLTESQLDQQVFSKAEGKDVLMLDYSLRTRELNDKLNSLAKSFRILDHHKSAREVLDGATYATFDMARSGAGLAWDYLFGKDSNNITYDPITGNADNGAPRPWWVDYTEDQDLWNWKLSQSEKINAFLMVQPRTVEHWNWVIQLTTVEAIQQGAGVRQYIEYYTRSVVTEAQEGVFVFEGNNYKTAVLNIPYAGVSEAGNALVKTGYDIAACWFERGDGIIQFSLRSNRDGSNVDVSAIAKFYGGGGHRNAAGFQIGVEAGRDLIDWLLGRVIYVPPRCV